MLEVLYEDADIIVAVKPPGVESQEARGLEPDMVSLIRSWLSTKISTKPEQKSEYPKKKSQPPYVGVIHRLDKPVGGVMVYAKNKNAAGALSAQVSQRKMKKLYLAVVCGKPVDNFGTYVDFLLKDKKNSCSQVVDNSVEKGREARLNYRVLHTIQTEETTCQSSLELSLLEIELLTGRYHQIRAQMAAHHTPVAGDGRYGGSLPGRRLPLALWAFQLTFSHPRDGRIMTFEKKPQGGAFGYFQL